jgi:ABC-2 type transport system ATP-binding protein
VVHPSVDSRAGGVTGADRSSDVPLVEVRDLVVEFGSVRAVAGLDLEVRAGRVLALVGGNGAGKSTTLRVLAGVVPPRSGTARVAGIDIADDPLRAKHMTGYCPDVAGLVPGATPWEHLVLAARLRRLDDHLPGWRERGRDLLARFELEDVAHRVTAGFSHGMSRRLSVLLAAFHRPPVLLLDEPFDGVDPLGVDATLELVHELRDVGSTVLVSTHLLDLAVAIADDAVVLRGGAAVGRCPAGDLRGAEGLRRYRGMLTG